MAIKKVPRRKRAPQVNELDACAVCDNGGGLTCCDGGCQRSFHLGDEDSEDEECRLALGISQEQAKMLIEREESFICNNCKYKQHQCFICGMLGSSDLSSGADVYQCKHEDCGYFYHPKCVVDLLYPDEEEASALVEIEMAAGEFSCPMHECTACKEGEDKNDKDMQFAVCRRCPTAYHRKCLPSDIPLKNCKGRMQRAWEGILTDRILMYCTKHEIVRKLSTPMRNHLKFPNADTIRVAKIHGDPPMEEDRPEEEEPVDQPSQEPPQSPSSASEQHQCSCSSPLHSFAPSSLYLHPQPGSSGGWLGD
ncbi:hypothetical protein ACP4OV_003481 [Aristida adscensionis]